MLIYHPWLSVRSSRIIALQLVRQDAVLGFLLRPRKCDLMANVGQICEQNLHAENQLWITGERLLARISRPNLVWLDILHCSPCCDHIGFRSLFPKSTSYRNPLPHHNYLKLSPRCHTRFWKGTECISYVYQDQLLHI
jgi:hypothetical protein